MSTRTAPAPAAAPPAALIALADPLRWQIVTLRREELCVCHLVEELDAPQSLVSHHLKVLREAGLVEGERWRYWTYYRLVPGAVRTAASQLAGVASGNVRRARRPCC